MEKTMNQVIVKMAERFTFSDAILILISILIAIAVYTFYKYLERRWYAIKARQFSLGIGSYILYNNILWQIDDFDRKSVRLKNDHFGKMYIDNKEWYRMTKFVPADQYVRVLLDKEDQDWKQMLNDTGNT